MPYPGGDRRSHGLQRRRVGARARRCCALWLAALVALSGCAASRSRIASGLPSRHTVRSHQVLLVSDGKIPEEEEILSELGRVRERVTQELGVPPGEREVVVYLFSDRERYANYMRKTHPDLPARRAFFIGTPKELAVYAHWGEHVLVDLRHEYTHGLLHAAIGHVPLWIDEGIAEYFEVGETTRGGVNPEHVGRVAEAAAHGWTPDLKRLEQLEQVDEMRREDYHEAWAWVYYLLHEAPGGRELISQYLNELRRGQTAAVLSARLGAQAPSAGIEMARFISRVASGEMVEPAAYRTQSSGSNLD